MHQWKQGHFEAAMPYGRVGVDGLVYRGLGLECVTDDAGGVWFDEWDVTHLASGCRIGTISGLDEAEAFKLATMLADLRDWTTLKSAEEMVSAAPELMTKLRMISDLSGGTFIVAAASGQPSTTEPEMTAGALPSQD